MDKRKEQTFDWLKAQMPGVAAQVADKRVKLGDAWVNECWRRGVREGEQGWFYAREGAIAVGMAWGDPLYFETLNVSKTQSLLMIRDKDADGSR